MRQYQKQYGGQRVVEGRGLKVRGGEGRKGQRGTAVRGTEVGSEGLVRQHDKQ